jgi:Calcineurin-like phosphoesterase
VPGPSLGRALPGSIVVGGVNARVYERGLALDSPTGEVLVHFAGELGRPVIWTGPGPQTLPDLVRFTAPSATAAQVAPLVTSALEGRLSVSPVGPGTTSTASLSVGGVVMAPNDDVHAVSLRTEGLANRQLYDVVLQLDGGETRRIAPHAIYFRQDWRDFGLAHITDMHVARRIDKFRALLREAGRDEAADRVINWNDRFRGFVRYANQLHDEGRLDLIVATGDLYDYIYETDDDPTGGGNPEFLAQLILGLAPGPDFPDVEELRVPLCVVPGNHDYRNNPYRLVFDLNAKWGGLSTLDVRRVHNHFGYSLKAEDAAALGRRLDGMTTDDVPNLSAGQAAPMVDVDKQMSAYEAFIGAKGSYVLELGPHRIVMLDTSWDVGVMTDLIDGVRTFFGVTSEDERSFVGGSPNCEGIDGLEFRDAVLALDNAPPGALVVLGMHAPLLNTPENEYPYFMRESQRPAQGDQPAAWVGRVEPGSLGAMSAEAAPEWRPTWFAEPHDHREVRFIKRGSTLEGLDYGVARGQADELLERIAGIGTKRRADLVLGGHTHRHNEFRVGVEDGEMRFYLDFYTSNPAAYYPTRYWAGPSFQVTHVNVVERAHEASSPWTAPADQKWDKVIEIPPYPNPLDKATDKRQWWSEHRPLVIQTSALGPLDNDQVPFSGFRLITVVDNVIENIHFLSSKRLEANQWVLPFEEAIRIDEPRVLPFVGRTEQFRLARSQSSPAGCVVPDNGTADIYYRDADGILMQLWRDNQGRRGFTDLTALAQGAPAAAGDPSAFLDTTTDTIHLLYRDAPGNVHCLYWAATGGVGHDNLSGAAGAPAAEGDPVGWYRHETQLHHVIYRSADGHLHTLYWTGAEAAQHEDLTAGAGLPAAAGDPSPYFGGGSNIVAYRGHDDHIYTTYWSDGAANFDNLSAFAGTPEAAGDPVTTYIGVIDLHQVVYRGKDGNLHVLSWVGANPTTGRNLTSDAGAPLADSDPSAFYNHGTNKMHVVYRTPDGHVIDVTWTPDQQGASYVDLTETHHAPAATMTPAAFLFGANSSEHVAFRSDDGHIHEFVAAYAKVLDGGAVVDHGGPGGTVVSGPVIR